METLALPFSVDDKGRLARTDAVTSLLSVIRAMAAAPASSWAHAPWFGLQEAFAAANVQLRQQPALEDALNRALAGLGVDWARVAAVSTPELQAPGERRFELTLELAGGRAVHRSLRA